MSGLPAGWVSVALQQLLGRTAALDPGKSPTTRFELWSVPSFSERRPETPLGSAVRSSKQIVQEDDVLLCKIVPHINRVWVVEKSKGLPQIASGEWIVLRGHGCDPHYLRYCLSSPTFRDEFLQTVSGVGGSLMRARPSAVAEIEVPLPPLAEQRRIVAKLDALTARTARSCAGLDRIHALAARYKQAVLAKEMAGHPDQLVSLSTIVDSGLIGLVRSKAEQNDTIGKPYVRMQHFDLNGFWNDQDLTRVSASDSEVDRFALRDGDVLFNTRNSAELVGKVALCGKDQAGFLYNNNLLRLRFSSDVLPNFAYRYMQAPQFRAHLEGQKSATTSVAAIYQGTLYQTPFWAPSVSQQVEIADRIDRAFAEIDRLVAEAAAARRLLDRLDQAVLAKAFRGELVPQDPADEPASVLLDRIRAERAAAPKARRGRKPALA